MQSFAFFNHMRRNIIYFKMFILLSTYSYSQNTPAEFEKKYQERIQLERINDVYIPLNLNEAMIELDKLTDKKKAMELLNLPEDSIASKLHFSLGRWMEINWGLEEGSRLSHSLKLRGLSFPDDMEDFIIRCWYRHLNKQDLNDQKLIDGYIIQRKLNYVNKLSKIKIDTLSTKVIKN